MNDPCYELTRQWPDIVGKEIAKQCAPRRIENSTLILAVKNHMWMQQLQFMQLDLLEKINQAIDSAPLTAIKLALHRSE